MLSKTSPGALLGILAASVVHKAFTETGSGAYDKRVHAADFGTGQVKIDEKLLRAAAGEYGSAPVIKAPVRAPAGEFGAGPLTKNASTHVEPLTAAADLQDAGLDVTTGASTVAETTTALTSGIPQAS